MIHAGFPRNPHRGFETVNYMLMGVCAIVTNQNQSRGVAGPGSVQWMMAGRGIVHSEMRTAGRADERLPVVVERLPATR